MKRPELLLVHLQGQCHSLVCQSLMNASCQLQKRWSIIVDHGLRLYFSMFHMVHCIRCRFWKCFPQNTYLSQNKKGQPFFSQETAVVFGAFSNSGTLTFPMGPWYTASCVAFKNRVTATESKGARWGPRWAGGRAPRARVPSCVQIWDIWFQDGCKIFQLYIFCYFPKIIKKNIYPPIGSYQTAWICFLSLDLLYCMSGRSHIDMLCIHRVGIDILQLKTYYTLKKYVRCSWCCIP